MSSQHPYAEDFIGKPHVWTVDYNNSEEFEAAIKTILRTQVRRAARNEPLCRAVPCRGENGTHLHFAALGMSRPLTMTAVRKFWGGNAVGVSASPSSCAVRERGCHVGAQPWSLLLKKER